MEQPSGLVLQPKQEEALLSPANEILYGGAAGGGKSYFLRIASILYALWIPGIIIYLFRRTFKELTSNHIYTPMGYTQMMRPMLDAGRVKWDKSNYMFEFDNGSIIQLAHCQWDADVENYQGAQIGVLMIDEATHFTEKMLRFLRSRVRLGGLSVPDLLRGLFPRIIYASNPGGISHDYFKTGFVDHGTIPWRAPPEDGGMVRQFIPARLIDNPKLLESDPNYADMLRGLGESTLVDAMLSGDWDIGTASIFGDVWDSKVHVIKPFAIPRAWKIDRSHDYGESAPSCTLYHAESNGETFYDSKGNECWVPRGSLFLVGEVYLADEKRKGLNLTPDQQADRFISYEKERFAGRVIRPGPADTAIWTKDRGSDSIHDKYMAKGISFVRGDKSPGSRKTGWSLAKQMLRATLYNDPQQPHYYVMAGVAPNFVRTVPSLPRDKEDLDDVDTESEDHLGDAFRYKILRLRQEPKLVSVTGT